MTTKKRTKWIAEKQKFNLKWAGQLALMGLSLGFPATSFGYQSTIDTGNLLSVGSYQGSLEAQFAGGDFSGTNANFRLDAGVNDSSNVRVLAGTGSTSFDGGLFYKWIPIPDFANQPAIGLISGFEYSQYNNNNYFSINARPIISKKLHTVEAGAFTPYAAVPISASFGSDKSRVPIQLAIGTEWQPENYKGLGFFGELGFNLLNAFDYVSFAVAYTFQ